jgi:hypothetical protein
VSVVATHAPRTSPTGETRRWKASWSEEVVVFDEATADEGSGGGPHGSVSARSANPGEAVATEDVSGGSACSAAAEQAAAGRHFAEEPSITAPPGPRGARRDGVPGFARGPLAGLQRSQSWRFAVKRSSTRGRRPRRGKAKAARAEVGQAREPEERRVERPGGTKAEAIGNRAATSGARVVSWLQKSERRIFLHAEASRSRAKAKRRQRDRAERKRSEGRVEADAAAVREGDLGCGAMRRAKAPIIPGRPRAKAPGSASAARGSSARATGL